MILGQHRRRQMFPPEFPRSPICRNTRRTPSSLIWAEAFESLTQLFGGSYVRVGIESARFKINPFSLRPPRRTSISWRSFSRSWPKARRSRTRSCRPSASSISRSKISTRIDPVLRTLGVLANTLRRGLAAAPLTSGPAAGSSDFSSTMPKTRFVFTLSVLRLPAHEPVPGASRAAALLYSPSRQRSHRRPPDQLRIQGVLHRRSLGVPEEPQHPGYIVEALKTWRKHNAAMILSTQSLDELKQSDILDVIIESCATKIFLANPDMDRELYRQPVPPQRKRSRADRRSRFRSSSS